MRRQTFALAAAVGLVVAMAATGNAAAPASGSVGPSSRTTTWAPVGNSCSAVTAWYSAVRFCKFNKTLPTPAFWPGIDR